MFRPLAVALLCAISLGACAQPAPSTPDKAAGGAKPGAAGKGGPEQAVRAALAEVVPGAEPDYLGAAPFPGFREVLLEGQVLYVSDDGRYLLQSQPIDLKARAPAASPGLNAYRRKVLAGVPKEERIVFAPANPAYTVTVFTDVECGYCRKLHQEIEEYNRRGIAIEYLAFPRMGPDTPDFALMESVWCAPDRRKALTDAKNDRPVPARRCANPVARHYALGQRVGLTGTPMIVTEDGLQMPGYLPPDALLAALQQAENVSGAAPAPGG